MDNKTEWLIAIVVSIVGMIILAPIIKDFKNEEKPEATTSFREYLEIESEHASLAAEATEVVRETAATETTTTETTIEAEITEETTGYVQRYYPSEYEFDLMSRVVMSEAGGESFETQLMVAETILNRYFSEKFPNDIEEVIYQSDQYSTHNNGTPTDSVMEAVQTACESQTYPETLYYFRDDYYHSFGVPYMESDNMYFSLGD